MVQMDAIVLNPKNRNKHPQEQIDRLAEIIKYQGFRNPVTISNRSGYLSAGEGRYLAAKQLGMTQIPAVRQDFDSEEQEYAYGVADNAIQSWSDLDLSHINLDVPDLGPDFDINMLGIKGFEIDVSAHTRRLEGEDEIPENPPAISNLGDIYRLGEHRLMCGDSTSMDAVDQLMNGETAEMIFTDPPYGVGLDYNDHDDADIDAYHDLMRGWFEVAKSQDCFIAATVGHKNNNWWFREYAPDSFLIWFDKTKQSPHSHAYLCKTELILLWGRPGKSRYSWDILDIIHERSKDESQGHPCPKPVRLIEEILRPDFKNILDLFGGSGTTMIACEKTNRRCFMMELDPKYIDLIIARWERFSGQKAELILAGESPSVTEPSPAEVQHGISNG